MTTQDDAQKFTNGVLADLEAGEIDSAYHYAYTRNRAESFMLAGNGPSAWLWVVRQEDGDYDHAYIEYADSSGTVLVPIDTRLVSQLLNALTTRA